LPEKALLRRSNDTGHESEPHRTKVSEAQAHLTIAESSSLEANPMPLLLRLLSAATLTPGVLTSYKQPRKHAKW